MTNMHRRLKKLEALHTDATGLAPYSPAWNEHWMREIERCAADDYFPKLLIPLDAFRSYLQKIP